MGRLCLCCFCSHRTAHSRSYTYNRPPPPPCAGRGSRCDRSTLTPPLLSVMIAPCCPRAPFRQGGRCAYILFGWACIETLSKSGTGSCRFLSCSLAYRVASAGTSSALLPTVATLWPMWGTGRGIPVLTPPELPSLAVLPCIHLSCLASPCHTLSCPVMTSDYLLALSYHALS